METASYKDFKILKKTVRNLYREKHNEESYKAQQKEYYEKFLEKYNKLNQQWEAIQKLLVSSKKSSEQKNENNGNIVDEEGILGGANSWIKKLNMIEYSLLNNGSEEQKLESKLNELIKKQQKKTTTVNELIELFKKLNESEEEKIQSKKEEKTIEEQAKEEQTKEEQAKEEQERFIYKIEKQITKDFNWLLLAEHDKDEKADADKKNIKNLYELYPKILKIFEKKLKAIEVLKRIPEEYYDQEDQLNKIHNQIQPLNDLASIVFKDIWGGKSIDAGVDLASDPQEIYQNLERKLKSLRSKTELSSHYSSEQNITIIGSVLETPAGIFWVNQDSGASDQQSSQDVDVVVISLQPEIMRVNLQERPKLEPRTQETPTLKPRTVSGKKLVQIEEETGLC